MLAMPLLAVTLAETVAMAAALVVLMQPVARVARAEHP